MAEFKMMTRPKKPDKFGNRTHRVWCSISIPELLDQVAAFRNKYPDLELKEITVDLAYDGYDYDSCGIQLEAPGKPMSVYNREMNKYHKELKAWKEWRDNHKDNIIAFKESEKKRIALAKLERRKARLLKEAAEVEAKLNKVK